eukprot:scaffold292546_cov37-Tisochrysis_lutea.AAC.1
MSCLFVAYCAIRNTTTLHTAMCGGGGTRKSVICALSFDVDRGASACVRARSYGYGREWAS